MPSPESPKPHQDADRPNLKQRAAALKTSAARVSRGRRKASVDPIFAVLAEVQRLQAARDAAYDLPQPDGAIDPLPEQNDAVDALHEYVDTTLLNTVPTTAAGCAMLARFIPKLEDREQFIFDQDETGNHHRRIFGLISKSPMLGSGGVQSPAAVDPSFPAPDADAALLDLGRQFDAAQATWRASREAAREPGKRYHEVLEAARRRGSLTMEDLAEAEAAPGYTEASTAEEAAFEDIDPWARAIGKLPARTIAGLAVRARAALFLAWPAAPFPELVEDPGEAGSLDVFHLIEACNTAAGVDWRGVPLGDLTDPHKLTTAILDGWAAWDAHQGAIEAAYANGTLPEDEDDEERPVDRRRYELMDAADALPATRESLVPKALALAWIQIVSEWRRGCMRGDHSMNGRLVLDIHEIARVLGQDGSAITVPAVEA